ncbi:MAG: class I SAM-dependent rRNA methyltransferase [Oligoflexia bacterium]|nr:class I SAM-dependent rRNA methyltransferase [Oligoflexia bacterium]
MHTQDLPLLRLNRYPSERRRSRHPWIFSNDIDQTSFSQKIESGSIVSVEDTQGKFVGYGFYSASSLIAIRIFSRDKRTIFSENLIQERLIKSLKHKNMLFNEEECGLTYRAINGEGDELPGLIIDKFQGAWVIEAHAKWVEKHLSLIVASLEAAEKEVFQGSKNAIVYRSDTRSSDLETIEKKSELIKGSLGDVFAMEHGIRFPIDVLSGQKTGFFFDQRENRNVLKRLALNDSLADQKSALDICCHLGAWGLGLAKAKYRKIVFCDRSEKSIETIKQIIEINKISGNFEFLIEDVENLKELLPKKEFDLVNIDPPALIQSKKMVTQGIKAYEKWNRIALSLLKKEGLLSSSSCSYHLFYEKFEELLSRCFLDHDRVGKLIYRGFESRDHSIVPEMPEGRYLKNIIFQMNN